MILKELFTTIQKHPDLQVKKFIQQKSPNRNSTSVTEGLQLAVQLLKINYFSF